MIVNSKAKMTRPITLEVSVQEQKLKEGISTRAKIERGGKKTINSELALEEKDSDISNRDACSLCNRPVKTGVECGICSRWFHHKCEGSTEERAFKEYPYKTHYIHL